MPRRILAPYAGGRALCRLRSIGCAQPGEVVIVDLPGHEAAARGAGLRPRAGMQDEAGSAAVANSLTNREQLR